MKITPMSHFSGIRPYWIKNVVLAIVLVCFASAYSKAIYTKLATNIGGIYLQKVLVGDSQAMDDSQLWLTRATSFSITNTAAYRFSGILHLKLGNYEAAHNALDQALIHNPQDRIAQIQRGQIFYEQGQYEAAMEIWYKAGASQKLLSLGDELSDATRWQEALSAYQYAFDLTEAPSATAYQRLAWAIWKTTSNADASFTLLDKGLQIWPDDVWLMIYIGRIYTDLQEVDEAQVWYERAKQINPDVANIWFGLGKQALENDNNVLAIEYFTIALEIKPDLTLGHYNLGLAYEQTAQYQNALAAFQNAVRLDSSKAWYHNALARTYRAMERFEDAVTAYEQTLLVDPENKTAHRALTQICQELPQIKGCTDAE